MATSQPKIKLLVVDDSATVRAVLCRELGADPEIELVGYARDGIEALEQVQAKQPDVVTLDIEMPRLNGLDALSQMMQLRPTPVVMVSSLTKQGADATIRALELGAVDFVAKPTSTGASGLPALIPELLAKVKQAARTKRSLVRAAGAGTPSVVPALNARWRNMVVVIGSSTGGPQALRAVLTGLPANFHVPILSVQHMPPGFTRALAERLDDLGPLRVEEARPGSKLEPGKVLVAPGGFHMTVRKSGDIALNQEPQECGVRPSVNRTMESVAAAYGSAAAAVILTGMGHDGTRGAEVMRTAGARILVEHESSCVVYGMPKSVVEAGWADQIVPLHQMAAALVNVCRDTSRMGVSA